MNWALVLGLLLCGSVLATGDYGFRESESEETEDDLMAELERDFLMLGDKNIIQYDDNVVCDGKTCNPGEICDTADNTCKCQKGKKGEGCEDFVVCTDELKEFCKQGEGKCIQDPIKNDMATCKCDDNKKFDGSQCSECSCGQFEEKCDFYNGEKHCSCKTGYADKSGTCESCSCGDDGAGNCTFEGEKQICKCNKGFSLKNDKLCEACSCGEDRAGNCTFEEEKQVCKCNKGFSLKGDKLCEACSCGVKGAGTCTFEGEKKVCKCNKGFSLKGDKMCDVCDCGEGTCSFDKEGNKKCSCKDKYAEKNGKCEVCDCGKGTCGFDSEGNKKCSCDEKYAEKNGKCEECDCGSNGKCSFNKDNVKQCECDRKYSVKNGKCEECDCGEKGKCSFVGNKKTCKCDDKHVEDDGICKLCYCGSRGTCSFKDSKKVCACNGGYKVKDGECHEPCDPAKNPCKYKGTCDYVEETTSHFCNCLEPFRGDRCEIIKECVDGEYKECEKTGGKCVFQEEAAQCVCTEPKKLDKNKCRKKCTSKDSCRNGATCEDDLCQCPDGTSGDDCSIVDGCKDDLAKTCKDAGATCVYQNPNNKAVCKCKDDNFEFDVDKCTPKWCKNNPCKSTSNCTFSDGAGRCDCGKGKYYDYSKEECIDTTKCPMTPCKDNRICQDGKCICAANYEEINGTCTRKMICKEKESYPCYDGATCTDGNDPGIVKCDCPPNTFYNLETKTCEDGKCFLPGNRKECETCPGDKLERNKANGNCEAVADAEKCTKNCGDFGYCLKKGDIETCVCIDNFAKNDQGKETEKCVLNAEKACISNKTSADQMKCVCLATQKQSKNGITCERKTCGDEDAQKDCQSLGKYCVDDLPNPKRDGYMCLCKPGYHSTESGCIDACAADEVIEACAKRTKVCYKNEKGSSECKCPPGYSEKTDLKNKKTCEPVAQNAFLIESLPVLSERYKESDSFNIVKLNRDIIQSMNTVYDNLEYSSLQQSRISEDGKVILCDVWLQFKEDATKTIKRWKAETVAKEKSLILPPALHLSKELDQATQEELNFCSPTVSLIACGQGSKCKDNKCSCDVGYRVIGPSVQIEADRTILRCADINECQENLDKCDKTNSKCVNTQGSYYCKCLEGFHKNVSDSDESQGKCFGLCTPHPCGNGECNVSKDNKVECSCNLGYRGSYCSEEDKALKKAQHNTTVVGAVLGTLLGLTFLAIVVYIVRLRKNSYSEDFSTGPRDNAEMAERSRPLRGVSNRAYQ